MPPPGVVHPRGVVERHDCSRWQGWGRGSVGCSSTAFASGFLARAAPEANEATFAPDVETKNIPQRADADGLKSAKRALGDRRVKRPRPARSRTCTLDSLHVCLSHALDARSDALPRRLSLRARRSRAVRRACFFPPRDGTNAVLRGSRARRAVRRDVPCVPRRCTQPELVPSESPVSSLRADDVRRVAFWRSRRARLRVKFTFRRREKDVRANSRRD